MDGWWIDMFGIALITTNQIWYRLNPFLRNCSNEQYLLHVFDRFWSVPYLPKGNWRPRHWRSDQQESSNLGFGVDALLSWEQALRIPHAGETKEWGPGLHLSSFKPVVFGGVLIVAENNGPPMEHGYLRCTLRGTSNRCPWVQFESVVHWTGPRHVENGQLNHRRCSSFWEWHQLVGAFKHLFIFPSINKQLVAWRSYFSTTAKWHGWLLVAGAWSHQPVTHVTTVVRSNTASSRWWPQRQDHKLLYAFMICNRCLRHKARDVIPAELAEKTQERDHKSMIRRPVVRWSGLP